MCFEFLVLKPSSAILSHCRSSVFLLRLNLTLCARAFAYFIGRMVKAHQNIAMKTENLGKERETALDLVVIQGNRYAFLKAAISFFLFF